MQVMHDFDKIQQEIKATELAIKDRFPKGSYTSKVLLWDDGTHAVETRHGRVIESKMKIFIATYYEGKLTTNEIDLDDRVMTVNEKGEERYRYLVDTLPNTKCP